MRIWTAVLPRLVFVALAVAAGLFAPPLTSQHATENFTAFAVDLNGGTSTDVVDFSIQRWSTDAERAQLLAILHQEQDSRKANATLLTALQKMSSAGYIRAPNRPLWDLRFARQSPLPDGGRRIVLGTDRPIGFREAREAGRSLDYPFTIVEMQLDKDDNGTGKILRGTRLLVDTDGNLVLENFGQQPVRFREMRRLK